MGALSLTFGQSGVFDAGWAVDTSPQTVTCTVEASFLVDVLDRLDLYSERLLEIEGVRCIITRWLST
jgi:hypothetical protein